MKIKSDDIILVDGRRGSGKSTFLQSIIRKMPRWILWDYNWQYNTSMFTQSQLTRNLYQLTNLYNKPTHKIIYQPADKSPEHFDQFCQTIFKMANITVIIEEIELYATSHMMPLGLARIIDVGRMRGIGLYCTCRRIKNTNSRILSNANHIISFQLIRPEDVEYLADIMGESAYKLITLPPYHYLWYNSQTSQTTIMKPVGK